MQTFLGASVATESLDRAEKWQVQVGLRLSIWSFKAILTGKDTSSADIVVYRVKGCSHTKQLRTARGIACSLSWEQACATLSLKASCSPLSSLL